VAVRGPRDRSDLVDCIADELKPYLSGRRISITLLRTRLEQMEETHRCLQDQYAAYLQKETGPAVRDRLLEVAKKSEALARALRHTVTSLSGLPVIFDTDEDRQTILDELDRIAASAAEASNEVHMFKFKDMSAKYLCAVLAYLLMNEFSARKPTTTPRIGLMAISSLLYELFTGIRDDRFDSVCRHLLGKGRKSGDVT
jgi:hypothetical protein